LQVLGLTNYSHDPDATALRNCIINDVETAKIALMYAIERLHSFAFVGTFETMRESLASWASMRTLDLHAKAWSSNKQHAFSYDDGEDSDEVCHSRAVQSTPCTTCFAVHALFNLTQVSKHTLYPNMRMLYKLQQQARCLDIPEELCVAATLLLDVVVCCMRA
jgi:hypothetical protein